MTQRVLYIIAMLVAVVVYATNNRYANYDSRYIFKKVRENYYVKNKAMNLALN